MCSLHFGLEGLKIFFELLTSLMLQTIKEVFDEIMLLASFSNQLMEMLMILEARIKEPFLQISMGLENPTNFPKGSFHLIKGIGPGSFTAVMAAR